ncbi:MAG: DUF4410 domain-containing protein [Verrucomicrobia bacterium]|nr:DUF4410 domain-containing protein [Verrucomicrobiota bacterium]
MKTITLARCSGLLAAVLATGHCILLAGCQSASTGNAPATPPPAPLAANPRPVVVHDFAFDAARLHTDQGLLGQRQGPVMRMRQNLRPEETPAEKGARLAELLSETITKELVELNIPACRAPRGSPARANALVVGGQFMEVDEGNRLKRAVIGFGTGATEVLVQVSVYDLLQSRDQPILVYGTGTGSKPMPGGMVLMNPYAMAAKYVLSRNASEKDVRNLGKQIAKDLAQVETGSAPRP